MSGTKVFVASFFNPGPKSLGVTGVGWLRSAIRGPGPMQTLISYLFRVRKGGKWKKSPQAWLAGFFSVQPKTKGPCPGKKKKSLNRLYTLSIVCRLLSRNVVQTVYSIHTGKVGKRIEGFPYSLTERLRVRHLLSSTRARDSIQRQPNDLVLTIPYRVLNSQWGLSCQGSSHFSPMTAVLVKTNAEPTKLVKLPSLSFSVRVLLESCQLEHRHHMFSGSACQRSINSCHVRRARLVSGLR